MKKFSEVLKNKFDDVQNHEKYNRKELPNGYKLCPFQSSPECEIPCNSRCAIYRESKDSRFNCPLSEISSMSFRVKLIQEGKTGDASQYRQRY
jgi:hypothetical protein